MQGDDVTGNLIITQQQCEKKAIKIYEYFTVYMVKIYGRESGPEMWIAFVLWIVMCAVSLPGTWGMWGKSQASFPHRQRWIRTVSAACQSLCSAYSWPKPVDCTDGFSQTPDRYSAWATGCQISQLERKTHTYTVQGVSFQFHVLFFRKCASAHSIWNKVVYTS